jgi:hypothetical protein
LSPTSLESFGRTSARRSVARVAQQLFKPLEAFPSNLSGAASTVPRSRTRLRASHVSPERVSFCADSASTTATLSYRRGQQQREGSRPVWRAIALTDQPRLRNATISTTSSRDNKPRPSSASTATPAATLKRAPDGGPPPRFSASPTAQLRSRAAEPKARAWGISMSTSEGVWRERGHCAPRRSAMLPTRRSFSSWAWVGRCSGGRKGSVGCPPRATGS